MFPHMLYTLPQLSLKHILLIVGHKRNANYQLGLDVL